MINKPHLADRMADIQPFYVMKLLARARELEAQGKDIVHMEIGEPDFESPQSIINAGIKSLSDGKTHYTPALGLYELRQAISRFYQCSYNADIAPERIVITPGASGALQLAVSVLINPGESMLMADPGYPCNRHFVRLVEGKTLAVPVTADTNYQLTTDLIKQYWNNNTVGALVASPSNPTGTIVNKADLQAIIDCVQERKGRLIVDEIYHGLIYEGETTSAAALSDDVFVVNSFSKYFGMTGWRIGWLVVPESYIKDVDNLAQNIFLAASTPAQYAALAAFEPEAIAVLEQRRQEFKQRRDYLLPALREMGFDIPVTPQGAFYLYAGCGRFTNDSYQFAMDILEKAGVGITPGKDFGSNQPEKYVRFAYTTHIDNLKKGVARLRDFLNLD